MRNEHDCGTSKNRGQSIIHLRVTLIEYKDSLLRVCCIKFFDGLSGCDEGKIFTGRLCPKCLQILNFFAMEELKPDLIGDLDLFFFWRIFIAPNQVWNLFENFDESFWFSERQCSSFLEGEGRFDCVFFRKDNR